MNGLVKIVMAEDLETVIGQNLERLGYGE